MNVYVKKQSFLLPKILIGIFVLLILIGFLNIFEAQIKNTFYFITSPLSKTFWRAGNGTSGFFWSFLNTKGLIQENNNLKEKNQKLLSEIAFLQETVKQGRLIKEVVQNTQEDDFEMVLVKTIGLDGDFILLDKGSDDGVLENMPIISSQKVLFGKISKAYKDFSRVMLISNKNSVVDVKIEDADLAKLPVFGAVKGSGNLSIYLDLISSDAEIHQGDNLITSGQEGVFPRGLLIGKITNSNKNDLKPFQTAQVQSFFEARNADNLFIITNYKKEK